MVSSPQPMCRLMLSAQVVVQDLHIDNDPLIANTDGDSTHWIATIGPCCPLLWGRILYKSNQWPPELLRRH